MSDRIARQQSVPGRVGGGRIIVPGGVPWAEGTEVLVERVKGDRQALNLGATPSGHVIVAGFGLPGRCVAEFLSDLAIPYTIVERNPATVAAQRNLGRQIIHGDITTEETLILARLPQAAALALTIPDEDEVLRSISVARKLAPNVCIIARANHSSKGMEAGRRGADDVVIAEQAVAQQFRALIANRFGAISARGGDER